MDVDQVIEALEYKVRQTDEGIRKVTEGAKLLSMSGLGHSQLTAAIKEATRDAEVMAEAAKYLRKWKE